MKKFGKIVIICLCLAVAAWFAMLIADRHTLSNDIIRLHVVGASNSEEDQQVKLQVRDAVLNVLGTQQLDNVDQAKDSLENLFPQLEQAANQVLQDAGMSYQATVTLAREAFPAREYDTFSLPAGVYESLRVTIGEGEGKNWWCVVFPSLCLPATSAEFEDTSVGAGFSDTLTDTLQQEQGYELRFFFLDCLGWLQNLFHRG